MSLPSINITFSAKASTAIQRSERGIVCLVIRDTTKDTILTTYKYLDDVATEDYTTDNYKAIADAFHDGAPKVCVVRIGDKKIFNDVKTEIDKLMFNWIACIDEESQADLVTYVKARNAKEPNKQVKAVVYNATSPNDKHIVNFCNVKIKRTDDETETDGYLYLGRIAGMLAATPFTRSATYYVFDDLESVTEVDDSAEAVDAGKFVIINDYGEPKVARAVNSLTSLATGENDSMKKITIIEAMDLIKADIASTFKADYIGKYKNSMDNQQIFIAAVNHYFIKLANDQILDNGYDNRALIDAEAQRSALIDAGTTEAEDWDDLKVKRNTVGSMMYLAGNIKILDAIEDLTFGISLV